MSLRIDKINSLVHHHISEILKKEISFKPGIFVTVSKVDTTKDLRYTRIFLSVYPVSDQAYIEATLKKELYHIQGSLNRKMQVKVLPRISFEIEHIQEKVEELDKLFEKIHKEEEAE